jgi:hypothetical protein
MSGSYSYTCRQRQMDRYRRAPLYFIFVLHVQYEAIGLLVAAKNIFHFRDDDRTEAKTDYLLLRSLLSIGLSVSLGILVKWMGCVPEIEHKLSSNCSVMKQIAMFLHI